MKKHSVNIGLIATILAASVAAYLTSFSGVFLFDDFPAIFRNVNVVGDGAAFWGHRWLVDLTFRLNLLFGGESPFSFHVVNLIVHVVNALLVFGLVRRTLMRIHPSPGWLIDRDLLAWAAGLLWSVHPLTTQAVTYICQRYESVTTLFTLAALYLFARGLASTRWQRWFFNGALAALLLGMGCKESMAVVPVLLLAYDHVFGGKSLHEMARRRGLFHVASFMMLMVLLAYQMQLTTAQLSAENAGTRLGKLGPPAYLYNQALVILHYVRLALWPDRLCFDYMWQAATVSVVGILAVVLHALLVSLSVFGVLKRKAWGFCGLSFYILLAPTSSIVPVADLAVEHRMYAPLVPLVVMAATAINAGTVMASVSGFLRTARTMMLFVASIVLIATGLGMATSTRNMYYWSERAMWQDVCSKRPSNLRARNDLASALSEQGAIDEALAEYYEVIGWVPNEVKERCDRGECMVTGSFDKTTPEYAYFVACANIGTMYCNEKRDYDRAFEWYLRALRIAPFHEGVRRSAKNILGAVNVTGEVDLNVLLNEAIRRSIEEHSQ